MAQSYIGKPISLISHSDVRYRGILAGIDPAASTIQLSNVYSMGTESRRPPHEFIPPVQEPYQYIIFRASEVKDLSVDEPVPPRRSVHDDPAVLGASAQVANPNIPPYPVPPVAHVAQVPLQQIPQQTQVPQPQPQPQHYPPTQQPQPQVVVTQVQAAQQPLVQPHRAQNHNGGQRRNPVHTAAASLETVERAIGDLRVSQAQAAAAQAIVASANQHQNHNRGGRRGGRGAQNGHGQQAQGLKVPATDFDFESMNAKFDKAALSPRSGSAAGTANEGAADGKEKTPEGGAAEGAEKGAEAGKVEPGIKSAYNPKTSFFDSLSTGTPAMPLGGGGSNGRGRRGGRGGGGGGRNRREEEREKNVATFGEPGGVGLMGPGAYVGGWGGYGRRGGRHRRGGATPTVSAPAAAVARG